MRADPVMLFPGWQTAQLAVDRIKQATNDSSPAVFAKCSKVTWCGSRVVVPDGPMKTHFIIIFSTAVEVLSFPILRCSGERGRGCSANCRTPTRLPLSIYAPKEEGSLLLQLGTLFLHSRWDPYRISPGYDLAYIYGDPRNTITLAHPGGSYMQMHLETPGCDMNGRIHF